ncbi:MAG: Eco57I restriction-modification methylase domain-containing protein [Armatimonadota bacterium]
MTAPLNHFQAATSAEKLRGSFYTPPGLARLVVERAAPRPGDTVLDPSCGDGELLVQAVRCFAARYPHADPRRLAESLVGLDSDPQAVAAARQRVAAAIREAFGVDLSPERLGLRHYDALELPDRTSLQALVPPGEGRLLVVGNPPYVEAKRLSAEQRRRLQQRYPEATTGAPDLYLYFLHACLSWLGPGDLLAFVLPNKCLVNANARALRERLLAERRLAGIDFATDTGAFAGAAVYPVVLYASGAAGKAAVLRKVDRSGDEFRAAPLADVEGELFGFTSSRAYFPVPADPLLTGALQRMVRSLPEGRLGELLDIRWTVSFHRRGLRERYVTPERPASPHARRFLGGGAYSGNGEVRRYELRWNGWWIDYDCERLREDGNALPDPALFSGPKIAICQNGRTLRAALDEDGYVLKDTFLCGLPRAVEHPLAEHPRALVGLLCSRAVHFCYSHLFFGGHVNGGYLHFLRSFLDDVPLGRWTEPQAAEVAELVRRRERAELPGEAEEWEAEIERRVSAAFGFSPEEDERIAAWAAADVNWPLRERVRSRNL